ncbi:TPA: hypothetical protein N0F65_000819 [Lagenidium giganteum]|uniref:Transposase n=1 Tax=Lagenidium giganteum TaxID=4803 RepID=A0AAV2Z1M3_9STRA|nr:TPA: hypothetical protein N0F65_000819 [Lagenidium giganteum]
MPRRPPLSEGEKGEIRASKRAGLSIRSIAKDLRRDPKTIRAYLRGPEGYSQRQRPGRPRKLTHRDRRRIFRLACTDGLRGAGIAKLISPHVSKWTVRRELHRSQNAKFIKRKKGPHLTAAHKANRIVYCQEKLTTRFDWSHVMISDEKKFNLDGPDGVQCYWAATRMPQQAYSTRVASGGSVQVWAAMTKYGTTELMILEGRQNAATYIQTLTTHLLPFVEQLKSREPSVDAVFQQDGAAFHRARVVTKWLQDHNIKTITWPAKKEPRLEPD